MKIEEMELENFQEIGEKIEEFDSSDEDISNKNEKEEEEEYFNIDKMNIFSKNCLNGLKPFWARLCQLWYLLFFSL